MAATMLLQPWLAVAPGRAAASGHPTLQPPLLCAAAARRPHQPALIAASASLHGSVRGASGASTTGRRAWGCPRAAATVGEAGRRKEQEEEEEDQDGEDDDDDSMMLGTSGRGDDGELELDLPMPEVRHQRPLPIKERKAWRALAETMAKEKKLVRVNVGAAGITQAFLTDCMNALSQHELVRVKLGDGSGLGRASAAAALERYLDCLCVHEVGFTVTLYRQKGLPRPTNTAPPARAEAASAASPRPLGAPTTAEKRKAARKRLGQQKPGQQPPAFEVL